MEENRIRIPYIKDGFDTLLKILPAGIKCRRVTDHSGVYLELERDLVTYSWMEREYIKFIINLMEMKVFFDKNNKSEHIRLIQTIQEYLSKP